MSEIEDEIEESNEVNNEWDRLMEDDVPADSQGWLDMTMKLRVGLIKKNVLNANDPKILARLDSLAAGIDRQALTTMKMSQDVDEGSANREVARELFSSIIANKVPMGNDGVIIPEIESSNMEVLDSELKQGDDTIDSVI